MSEHVILDLPSKEDLLIVIYTQMTHYVDHTEMATIGKWVSMSF